MAGAKSHAFIFLDRLEKLGYEVGVGERSSPPPGLVAFLKDVPTLSVETLRGVNNGRIAQIAGRQTGTRETAIRQERG